MLEIQKKAMLKLLAKTLVEAAKETDRTEKYGFSIFGGAKWIDANDYIYSERQIKNAAKKLHGVAACEFNTADELEAVYMANKILRKDDLFIFAPGPYSLYVGKYSHSV